MAIDVLQAAKHLAKNSDWKLTRLELQKMIYLAHMLHLGRTGKPLVKGDFEAWDYGPVHPTLYYFTKQSESLVPSKEMFDFVQDLDDSRHKEEIAVLNEISSLFSAGSSWELVEITHWKGGAWAKNYHRSTRDTIIPQEDIKKEYVARLA